MTFSVDGTTCSTDIGSTTVGLDHPFTSDLVATLTSPGGVTVLLFGGVGGEGGNVGQAVLTDSATRDIQRADSSDASFTGAWRPAQPLSDLVGADADEFTVADLLPEDTGSIRAVSLHVSGFVAPRR